MNDHSPILYLVATPIGNLSDMSLRAMEVLKNVDAIACEDTRRTGALLKHFEITKPCHFLSYWEHREKQSAEKILELMGRGMSVALCTDGGYPGINDPGYYLTNLVIKKGFNILVIPGASAVPLALLKSGLPTSSYTFKGFPPRKPGHMHKFFEMDKDLPHTMVLYESPYRVAKTLAVALKALGNRKAALCMELTKKFERVSRGYLADLAQKFTGKKIKGEVTLVIAGNHPKFTGHEHCPS